MEDVGKSTRLVVTQGLLIVIAKGEVLKQSPDARRYCFAEFILN